MARLIQLIFGIGGAPPQRNLNIKIYLFLFTECRAKDV